VQAVEEAEGRQLLGACEPIDLRPDALEVTLSRLKSEPTAEPVATTPPTQLGDAVLPGAVARIGLRGRRYLSLGLWSARVDLPVHDDWRTFMLRVPVGTTVPSHGHSGEELVAVLAGSFNDGNTYTAGDFVECGAGRTHDLKVVGDQPCVCLISIRGRLLWKGWSQIVGLALEL
jgi:putative transcriptional regulator